MKRLMLSTMVLFLLLAASWGGVGHAQRPSPAHPVQQTGGQAPAAYPWAFETVDEGRNIDSISNRSLAVDAAGRPHITCAGEHLYYAYQDADAWQVNIVDASKSKCPALVLDSDGWPHIAYYDEVNTSLNYAHYNGSTWMTETVVTVPGHELCPSLALDAGEHPHLSVCPSVRSRCYSLWYASRDDLTWHIEVVSEGNGPMGSSAPLALDAAGRPRIAFENEESRSLVYASHDGAAWSFETVEAGWSMFNEVALALDMSGNPHILHFVSQDSSLHHAHWDGSAWNITVVDSGSGVGLYLSLVLDATGRPRASYTHNDLGTLQYAVYDGIGWDVTTVVGSVTSRNALALDAADRPRLLYFGPAKSLVYAYDDGDGWQHNDILETTIWKIGAHTSLELDAAGWPHISYYDVTNADLKYAYRDAAGWHLATVDSTGAVGTHTSLELDAAGRPHISYYDQTNEALRYAYYDGTHWISTTVDVVGDWSWEGGASLALDAEMWPHISYYDAIIDGLVYARFDGDAWNFTVVESASSGPIGYDSSLALDSQGRPHISYCEYSWYHLVWGCLHPRYAYFDGAAWHIEYMHEGCDDSSLALDSADRPHVACLSTGYLGYKPLGYAYRTSPGDWHFEFVDRGEPGEVTSFAHPSLALDSQDRPHIGYYDAMAGDLKYAYHDGVTWTVTVVDAAGVVGSFPSLDLDADGFAHVSYYDETGGDLRYAHKLCVPVSDVDIAGPTVLPMGVRGLYTATYEPITASWPIVTWDNGAVGRTATYSWTTTGTHTLATTATNPCSQAQETFTVTVFCQPPEGVAVSGPGTLTPGLVGTYQAGPQPITASLPLTFTWDNGTAGSSAAYSWPATGTYTLTVTATNACGQGWGTWSVRVLEEWPCGLYVPLLYKNNMPPPCQPVEGADFSWQPLTPTVGQVVTFTGSASGTAPLTYTWALGGGITATGQVVTHSYAASGTYPVTMTARNPCGTLEVVHQVRVESFVQVALLPRKEVAKAGGPVVYL